MTSLIKDSISFISISNWRLDLSKMSRCLYVTRSDPNVDVLQNTARQIFKYSLNLKIDLKDKDKDAKNIKLDKNMMEEANRIGSVYHDFRIGIYKSFDVSEI